MFLEPLQHNFSLVTWGVVLLEHSISSWKNRGHVRMQLIRNDVQIPSGIHDLLYHSTGHRDTQGNVRQSIIPPPPTCA
ncbi:uncharacterized protein TNCV_1353641 [Trichonephila clavipes]|nr:uncharacterized protein TNCV_1353641 [Trichonephila clavipes]